MMLTQPEWDWNRDTLIIDQDPMTHEQNKINTEQKPVQIDLRIATYNVQSLAKPDKAAQISKQCKKKGYHIIGIQESGTSTAGQPSDLNYWRIAAGPQGEKKGDVEIWIAKSFPIATAPDGEKIKIMEHHINVLMAHQRWMMVAIRTPVLKIDVMSIHAPVLQRGCPKSVQEGVKFWKQIDAGIKQRVNQNQIIILMDANTKLGRQTSPSVGNLEPDETNQAGTALHDMLLTHGLSAVNTFPHIHQGRSHTWENNQGHKSRIDYV